MEEKSTVSEVLLHLETAYQNPKALNEFINGNWVSVSTQEMLQQIKEIAMGLYAIGVEKGQRIAILAFPSPRWTMVDLSIIVAGAVSVPIFPNIAEESLVFEIEQTDARLVFLGEGISDSLYESHKDLFTKVICIDENSPEPLGMSLNRLREEGRKKIQEEPKKYSELLNQIKPDDLATIIYTSGSTGIPKGAEITQRAMTALITFEGFSWKSEKDRYLNILPLAHVFGRMLNFCLVGWSVSVYYLNDPKLVAKACQMIHPTILVVVPRLLEKIYARLIANVDQAGFLKRTIGHWAFDLANDEHDDSLYKQLLHPIADKIVYSTLREAFGGEIRIIISGGAPLNPHLAHFYIDIGLPIYEGWGLTEAATVCVNCPGHRKIGTVGRPLTGMKIKIGQEGEVLVSGPILMKGYYKNSEMTKEAFNSDGWLRTGDKGIIDNEGYLTLRGRIKEMLKTSTGEYVVPVPIEQALSKIPVVDMAMVIAEGRKYTTCIIFPDIEILHKLKENKDCTNLSDEEFVNSPFIRQEMQKALDEINKHLSKAEKVLDFRMIPHAPTIEKGELTPSMKIRRDEVEKKYMDLINRMYPEDSQ